MMNPTTTRVSKPPIVQVDAAPMGERHLTGIGRYTARVALALANAGAEVRFFENANAVLPPPGLSWDQDQDLEVWGHRVAKKGRRAPLGTPPAQAIGVFPCLRPFERRFGFEISILHDFTPLVVPETHSAATRHHFQCFFKLTLPHSDAAIAVSHATKADAGWLCDFDQDRITVAHSGPSLCVNRHLHAAAVERRSNVGLVVSTLEPRKNADFLLDWFRNTKALPPDMELWWAGRLGWMVSRRRLRKLESASGRRVRLLGVVPDRELCALYQTAAWTVYPSLYEGFGFPVLDSLRHGAPVLASGNSSLREFPHAGVFLFDPHDPATLDSAYRQLEAARPIAIDRARLDRHYNWDRVARAILDLPESHRKNRRRGPRIDSEADQVMHTSISVADA